MSQEQAPDQSPRSSESDTYKIAFTIGDLLLEYFQARGEIRRPSEITSEWEQDDHFEDLSDLYRQVCEFMGLAWPPPARSPADDRDIS